MALVALVINESTGQANMGGNNLVGVGTLTTTGLVTSAGGVRVTGGNEATGAMWKNYYTGLSLKAVTGSQYDFKVVSANGGSVMAVPTGTNDLRFFGGFRASGDVGIGDLNTAPTGKLYVRGDIVVSSVGAPKFGVIRGDNNSTGLGGAIKIGSSNTPSEQYIAFGTTPSGALGEASFTEKMRVAANGNVGIGTNSPEEMLDVRGTVHISTPGLDTMLWVGAYTTGKTSLQIATSADTNGYCYLQSIKTEGSAWGDLILNPNGGMVGAPVLRLAKVADPGAPAVGYVHAHAHTDGYLNWRGALSPYAFRFIGEDIATSYLSGTIVQVRDVSGYSGAEFNVASYADGGDPNAATSIGGFYAERYSSSLAAMGLYFNKATSGTAVNGALMGGIVGAAGGVNIFLTPNSNSNVTLINFQGGKGIVYLEGATTVPTGNPSGGGFLYVEAGALKYRGTSGTVTTIGPA